MSVPVHCAVCGYRGIARSIKIANSTNISLGGGIETCPKCGGRAQLQSGTYDFVGTMITAFRAPDVTGGNIRQFGVIARSVEAGKITQEEADHQIKALGSTLVNLWTWLNANGTAIQTIVAVIALFLLIYYENSADDEAASLLAATTEQSQIERSILSELQKREVHTKLPHMQSASLAVTQPPAQQRRSTAGTGLNRHERRKAASLAKDRP